MPPCAVGEAFAVRALNRNSGVAFVRHVTSIPTELELVQVQVQVATANAVKRAGDSTLEQPIGARIKGCVKREATYLSLRSQTSEPG